MFIRATLGLSLTLLAFSTACQQAPDTHDADVKGIRDAETAWVQAFAAKDVDKIASFYAGDATVLIPNEPALNGIEPIKGGLKPMLADPNFKLAFNATKVDVAKSGDLAYSQGPCTMTMTDPATNKPMDDKCKYLTVWRKQADGSWKAVQDTFSSDRPLVTAAPAPKKARAVPAKKKRK